MASIVALYRTDMCCEWSKPYDSVASTQYSRVPNMQYVAAGQAVQPLPCQNAPPNFSTATPATTDEPPEYGE